jgi:hypothetical protein
MNNQNILKFYGSKLDIKLDSSELYDYELSKVRGDYNVDVLDLSTQIYYSGLTIDDSLENFDCQRETITLKEVDNRVNDSDYNYLDVIMTVNYSQFVSHFGTGFIHTILNNNIFSLILSDDSVHYFKIVAFNRPLESPRNDENGILNITDNSLITSLDGFNISYTESILSKDDIPLTFNSVIDDFSTEVIECQEKLESLTNCCSQPLKLSNKPWAYKFNTGDGVDNCDPIIKRRTEKGWTLDFIFNRESLPWSLGGVFYYIGVRGEDDIRNYADNNLSFRFTADKKIKWNSFHYSGYCGTNGYGEDFYLASGETPQLCVNDENKDFNITIVFDRNKRLTDCNVENDGGWNDMVGLKTIDYVNTEVTGVTSTTTTIYSTTEELNKKWADERQDRLGTLKIYLNGRPIYKLKNWEEIITSDRGVQPHVQSWGGGTGLMNNVHNGVSCFNIKSIKYYEEPLDFVHVRHNFLTRLNQYDFSICGINCDDDISGITVISTSTT